VAVTRFSGITSCEKTLSLLNFQTARWPVPTCADILRSSIDYLTLDKRKKGGWVLGFEFLALSFLDKNESLDALVVVA
jgi:hypothetical protein